MFLPTTWRILLTLNLFVIFIFFLLADISGIIFLFKHYRFEHIENTVNILLDIYYNITNNIIIPSIPLIRECFNGTCSKILQYIG
jgi:hypothetical protein